MGTAATDGNFDGNIPDVRRYLTLTHVACEFGRCLALWRIGHTMKPRSSLHRPRSNLPG